MIRRVDITDRAAKDAASLPDQVRRKLHAWVLMVEADGLEMVRRIPGFHDEPLKGERRGQRSIRLNKAYRAIYEIKSDLAVEFVSIEEVNKHKY